MARFLRTRRALAARMLLCIFAVATILLAIPLSSSNFADDPPPPEEPPPSGDMDGDDVKDSIEPDPDPPGSAPGEVEIRSGDNGTLIVRIRGGQANDRFGYSVAVVDDLNQDGHKDLLIGAPQDSELMSVSVGRAYVFLGPFLDSGPILITAENADRMYFAPQPGEYNFGDRVAPVSDIDADGVTDLRIRCWFTDENQTETMRTYVISGLAGRIRCIIDGTEPFDPWFVVSGDTDGDGDVDQIDLETVLNNIGLAGEPGSLGPADGDLNADGAVNGLDLAAVQSNMDRNHFRDAGMHAESACPSEVPSGFVCRPDCSGQLVLLPMNAELHCGWFSPPTPLTEGECNVEHMNGSICITNFSTGETTEFCGDDNEFVAMTAYGVGPSAISVTGEGASFEILDAKPHLTYFVVLLAPLGPTTVTVAPDCSGCCTWQHTFLGLDPASNPEPCHPFVQRCDEPIHPPSIVCRGSVECVRATGVCGVPFFDVDEWFVSPGAVILGSTDEQTVHVKFLEATEVHVFGINYGIWWAAAEAYFYVQETSPPCPPCELDISPCAGGALAEVVCAGQQLCFAVEGGPNQVGIVHWSVSSGAGSIIGPSNEEFVSVQVDSPGVVILRAERAECVGEVAIEVVGPIEIDAFVNGESARQIVNLVDRSVNADTDDDTRVISGGHVRFKAKGVGSSSSNITYEWLATGGVLDSNNAQEEVDWDAPFSETPVTITCKLKHNGQVLCSASAVVNPILPRVVRVQFVDDGSNSSITLKDEGKDAVIAPPQYDRIDTEWERASGHEAHHQDHVNDLTPPMVFKNESIAYVKGAKMCVRADLAATDLFDAATMPDGSVNPDATSTKQKDLSVATPVRLRVDSHSPSAPFLTFKGTNGEFEGPPFDVQDWSAKDYYVHPTATMFTSDQPLGEDGPATRFYWETTLTWPVMVMSKSGAWVNARGSDSSAQWRTAHRSLCVANAHPVVVRYVDGRDIDTANQAWEMVMQYSCDWAKGNAGGSAAADKAVIDALWAGMAQPITANTGARRELEYTIIGPPNLVKLREFLINQCRAACGMHSMLFISAAAAQGLFVDYQTVDFINQPFVAPVINRAVTFAVNHADVDGNWFEIAAPSYEPHPFNPPLVNGNVMWWYNAAIPFNVKSGNHALCTYLDTTIYDPSFGITLGNSTWSQYISNAIHSCGINVQTTAGLGHLWVEKSQMQPEGFTAVFVHKKNDAQAETYTWPPFP